MGKGSSALEPRALDSVDFTLTPCGIGERPFHWTEMCVVMVDIANGEIHKNEIKRAPLLAQPCPDRRFLPPIGREDQNSHLSALHSGIDRGEPVVSMGGAILLPWQIDG
jgi:hypothetical protein